MTCPFMLSPCLMHLGHPIPQFLHNPAAVDLVLSELKSQLNELHSLPIQVLDRNLLVDNAVLPTLLYRTECLPLTEDQLHSTSAVLEKFAMGVLGLRSLIARKNLYTHRSHGLGLGHFPTLHPTHILDSLHRNQLGQFDTCQRGGPTPYARFEHVVSMLGTTPKSRQPPGFATWEASALMRDSVAVVSVAGLTVYLLPSQNRPHGAFTDGSKCGLSPSAGAAAVLRDGRIAVCRVPGAPNSYKAELVGILLGSHFSSQEETLYLDCQGAIASAGGTCRPVRQAFWVTEVRAGQAPVPRVGGETCQDQTQLSF